jgi:uncharacterized membrane protein YfcA
MLASLAAWLGTPDVHGAVVLAAVAATAGLVRGFVGFGAGMVFVPVAAAVVGPAAAVGLIWTIDAPITFRYAAGALIGCRWGEIGPLLAGALAGLPVGLTLLTGLDPVMVRWATAVFILGSVAVLASGWRYRRRPGIAMTFAVGFFSGITTGLVGIGGPFIALFWLGGRTGTDTIRQNLNAYFGLTTVTIGPAFMLQGIIDADLVRRSLPLIVLYSGATLTGVLAYRLAGQRSYRPLALVMAALAALSSLPALDPYLR